jgi:hypothetical protein
MRIDRVSMIIAFSGLLCFLAMSCLAPSAVAADNSTGAFELVVKDSKPLKPGTSKIRSQSAFASRVHGLVPGNADGIEIVFVTKPITDAMLPDILKNDARELRRGDYAALVLFLDNNDNVAQVNLSYVVPGTTVARTIAWKPDELRQKFSRVTIRGGRVVLKSKGTYAEIESGHEALQLTWDIEVDLPVIREVTR